MKKLLNILACVLLIASTACTKNNDDIKAQLEKALPVVEVTSLGLLQQTGPFLTTDVIQVSFSGALTNATPGAFDVAWYDAPATGKASLIASAHFTSWNQAAVSATGNNAINCTLLPTTYPNTSAFAGNLILKLVKLPAGGKSYSLFVYARTSTNVLSAVSISKFITMN